MAVCRNCNKNMYPDGKRMVCPHCGHSYDLPERIPPQAELWQLYKNEKAKNARLKAKVSEFYGSHIDYIEFVEQEVLNE